MFNDIVKKEYHGEDAIGDNFDYKKEYRHLLDEIQRLADYLQTEFGERIGEAGSLGATDEAIRLLKDYKKL